jgi:hypothetical protein
MSLGHRLSITILLASVIGASAFPRQQDSVRVESSSSRHALEVGINQLGVGIDYRYHWFSWVSTDAVLSASEPGIAVGLTVLPIPFFFVQGVLGVGAYSGESIATDGPPAFKPDYLVGWKAGIHVPLAPKKSRMYLTFAGGRSMSVQNKYQYNGGGFLMGPPPAPLYRAETRFAEVFSISLGFPF